MVSADKGPYGILVVCSLSSVHTEVPRYQSPVPEEVVPTHGSLREEVQRDPVGHPYLYYGNLGPSSALRIVLLLGPLREKCLERTVSASQCTLRLRSQTDTK
jgi:hypothetical protein